MSICARVRLTLRPAHELSDAAIDRALRLAGAREVHVTRGTGIFPFADTVDLVHEPLSDAAERNREIAVASIVWLVCGDPRVRVPGTSDNGFPQLGVNVLIQRTRRRVP